MLNQNCNICQPTAVKYFLITICNFQQLNEL